ncbi:MAG: MMPL family transporter [Acidimicrobiales bacterium]
MLARIGRWSFRNRWITIGVWLAVLVGIAGLAGSIGSAFSDERSIPSSESADGITILEQTFGKDAGGVQNGTIVFASDQQVTDPAVRDVMVPYFEKVATLPHVTSVVSPYDPLGARQIASTGDKAGHIAYARVNLSADLDQAAGSKLGKEIRDLAPKADGLRVKVGGQVFAEFTPPNSETIGLAFAIVVLILAFGSVLAMGLPISVAIAGVATGAGLITLLSHVMSVPEFATTIGAMIGLGVGIDYALFIVTRYREGLHKGMSPEVATGVAMDTAGRAVLFAGLTVVISLLGMLLIGLSFVSGLGIAAATTVLVTMIASTTLLPALLGFAQHRVEVTRWRGLIAAGLVAVAMLGAGLKIQPLTVALPLAVVVIIAGFFVPALKREVPRKPPKPVRETVAYKWSRLIQARPWLFAISGVVLLVVLAAPVLSLRLGFSDEGNFPAATDTKQAYDLVAEGFGPGFNGPFMIVTKVNGAADLAPLVKLSQSLATTPGVAQASPPIPNDPANPTAAIIQVVPTTSPQDAATEDLVHRLRTEVVPAAVQGTDVQPKVSGFVPIAIDFSSYLAGRMIAFFAVVLTLSFLLLMAVFRSVLVPLKAVIMNMLSLGAAYGISVAIFQWGWGGSILGISGAPIEPFIPMMMFAIVFGLSMDYEVFLLSRIKEEYDLTGDARTSVADGLAATARVITAAAAIMVVVFGSFLFEENRIVKLFGLGLAVAVLLDATIIRMLLVPATMELLGEKNWWLPRWLDRILPHIAVEGHPDDIPLSEMGAATTTAGAGDDVEEVPTEDGRRSGEPEPEPVG